LEDDYQLELHVFACHPNWGIWDLDFEPLVSLALTISWMFGGLKQAPRDHQGLHKLDGALLWWMWRGFLSVATSCFGLPS
jgi:hypothetical protein